MVKLDPEYPCLMLDGGFFVFFRWYALYNYYKLSSPDAPLDVPNILLNHQFIEKFDKLFEDNIDKLAKKNHVPYKNVVFCKDCMRDNIWRYEFFTPYKRSREERLTTFNGDIFKHCYNTLLPKLSKKMGIQTCEHPRAEADDIIAVFTRSIQSSHPATKIIIVTNDNDYLQLIADNVKVVNMKNMDLKSRLTCDPLTYLKMKIIMGDKSDNIPSVFPKCGEKRAQQLAEDDELLEERLSKSDELRERYELNSLLIDTRRVPDKIQQELKAMLQLNVNGYDQDVLADAVSNMTISR